MEPALDPFSLAVAQTRFSNPRVPIHSNVNNLVLTKGLMVQKTLPKQLVRPVQWESSICQIFKSGPNDSLPSVYECGPGRGLSCGDSQGAEDPLQRFPRSIGSLLLK